MRRTAKELFVPFCVGGGIKSARDAEQVFTAGADKVSINSAALAHPSLITDIGASFGAQAVVVAAYGNDMAMMHQPVQDGGGDRRIGEYRPHSPTLRVEVISIAPFS